MTSPPPAWPPPLQAHWRLLERWRKAMDLVGPGPLEPHFADAAEVVGCLPAVTGRWVDLGSGAGFPGVALATRFPDAEVWWVERRSKRVAFLEAVAAEARLPRVQVRLEDAETLPAGSFDGVISRAFRPPAEVLKLAAKLLKPGGLAVLLLGDAGPPTVPGFVSVLHHPYRIEGRPRQVVVFRYQPE